MSPDLGKTNLYSYWGTHIVPFLPRNILLLKQMVLFKFVKLQI